MRLIKIIFASLYLALCLPTLAVATEQIPDKITVNGRTVDLQSEPLRPYLEHNDIQLEATSSANWRGYLAQWEITPDQLQLRRIYKQELVRKANDYVEREIDIADKVMPGVALPVLARWYTGTLVIGMAPHSNANMHMGYSQLYDRYLLVKVEKGLIAKRRDIKRKEFDALRKEQFARYMETEAYQKKKVEALTESRQSHEVMKQRDPKMAELMGEFDEAKSIEAFNYVLFAFGMDDYLEF